MTINLDNDSESEDAFSDEPQPRQKKPALVTLDSEVFADVDVQLTAVLGRGRLTVQQLLNLSAGDAIDLDTPLDGVVDITLNDRIIAQGEIVAVEDHFGVRITRIAANKQ